MSIFEAERRETDFKNEKRGRVEAIQINYKQLLDDQIDLKIDLTKSITWFKTICTVHSSIVAFLVIKIRIKTHNAARL